MKYVEVHHSDWASSRRGKAGAGFLFISEGTNGHWTKDGLFGLGGCPTREGKIGGVEAGGLVAIMFSNHMTLLGSIATWEKENSLNDWHKLDFF